MRLLAINQFYAPDLSATSQLLTQLCEDLAELGDDVSVIASRGSYLGGGSLPAREELNGVTVMRPWATGFGKRTIAHRLADYGSFWAGAVATAVRAQRPDVMLVLSTPPMIAFGAALVSAARSVPLVSWVQDVYPEVALAFGVLREGHPASHALRGMNRFCHRVAAIHVALADDMAARLTAQGLSRDQIRVVHNWADAAAVHPVERASNGFRREHGLEGKFVAMYSGNIGQGHDVATLAEAARKLAHTNIEFVIIGEGARKAEAVELTNNLPRVRFLPYQPRECLAESLSAADIHLVSLRAGLEGLLVPSKVYGIMAAGRPVAYLGPRSSEVARLIEHHRIGWAGRPGQSSELAAVLEDLSQRPDEASAMGARAREALCAEYDRPHAVRRWRDVLLDAI